MKDTPVEQRTSPLAWLIAGLFFLSVGALGLLGHSKWNPLVSMGETTAEKIAGSTVVVYVSLRAINAALSTAQEVELGASVVGQASLQPLKVLEPIDDTVERVADAVFVVATGAALATVGLAPVVSVGLIVLGLSFLGRIVAGRSSTLARSVEPMCRKGINFGLVVGFAVPIFFTLGVWAGERATAAQMREAEANLSAVSQQARILIGDAEDEAQGVVQERSAVEESEPAEEDEGGYFGWFVFGGEPEDGTQPAPTENEEGYFSQFTSGVGEVFDQGERYLDAASMFKAEADTILWSSLTIVGIFALRLLILPVFLLWGALSLMKAVPRQ